MTGGAPRLVLLAAGLSRRYGSPKQLDPVGPGGAALPAYTVADALAAGFAEVVVVTRPELQGLISNHLRQVLGPGAPIRWALQRLDDLPPAYAVPSGRLRPWGTGHAVLAAAPAVAGQAFGVANADDWYGPEALMALAQFLRDAGPGQACLVGYPLSVTLSPHGGVSRGRIRHDGSRVTDVEECTDVARTAEGELQGRDPSGRQVILDPQEPVSMNLWGLPPDAPALLATAFRAFLQSGPGADAEFLLSQALGALAGSGALSLRLLPAGRRWFGVTHPEDRPEVVAQLAALHDDGTYAHHDHLRAGSAPT